jgi:hypothetical protein
MTFLLKLSTGRNTNLLLCKLLTAGYSGVVYKHCTIFQLQLPVLKIQSTFKHIRGQSCTLLAVYQTGSHFTFLKHRGLHDFPISTNFHVSVPLEIVWSLDCFPPAHFSSSTFQNPVYTLVDVIGVIMRKNMQTL